jgi:hypothetical protein
MEKSRHKGCCNTSVLLIASSLSYFRAFRAEHNHRFLHGMCAARVGLRACPLVNDRLRVVDVGEHSVFLKANYLLGEARFRQGNGQGGGNGVGIGVQERTLRIVRHGATHRTQAMFKQRGEEGHIDGIG